ncbi:MULTISPECIES: TfoX/Sxy family protein [unclassified Robiginitalea]|uniref:TfoX/Sxy family protein n=1 Tax=Robiginitalea TaxID=252306 RepID=UPI00234B4C28|nr:MULTISPECIES: TfoX/Sxy family protein [unclassified Robiginitalea]MDC6353788.1 TfoX/Sxy family protein [Robiginitalea sp. PM2]MDC6374055.1 TfoX/Sxy family protein [Robiginitalea sp. SP8]
MPYSKELEDRLNRMLEARHPEASKHLTVKYMFGGLAYLYKGKMSVGVVGHSLMARVPANAMEQALLRRGARPMDFTGRVMKEFVFVDPEGFRDDSEMEQWIEWGLEHARQKSAPPKRIAGK